VSPEPRLGQSFNIVTLLGVGATFGVCVGLGVFLGVLADNAAGTSPLLALAGTLVGILAGAGGAYQIIRPYTRNSSSRPRKAEPDNDVRSDTR
jgi:F0F1-type ATP synthase assembly protein I